MTGLPEGLTLRERLEFSVRTSLEHQQAVAFVRDVARSLAAGKVLEDLHVTPGLPALVSACLPINTPLFGRRQLRFVSELRETVTGAALVPTTGVEGERAWAEVGGEAIAFACEGGSRLDYALDLTIHLDLPDADRWGTRALTRMIELTAGTVLRSLSERLRLAMEEAARTWL